MAGSSLLVLLDDITLVLDDVAAMSKVAAKKTAGVLGDDLALNAEQVSGIRAERELPVVWAVAKGSMLNKVILVPAALAISAVAPWAITPLLMVGGAYLCFEGVEKLAHKWLHPAEDDAHAAALSEAAANPEIDLAALEKDKVKGHFAQAQGILKNAAGSMHPLTAVAQCKLVSHQPPHRHDAAVPRVDIDDDGEVHAVGNPPGDLHALGHGRRAHIRQASVVAHHAAGADECRFATRLLHDARGLRGGRVQHGEHLAFAVDEFLQALGFVGGFHCGPSCFASAILR